MSKIHLPAYRQVDFADAMDRIRFASKSVGVVRILDIQGVSEV